MDYYVRGMHGLGDNIHQRAVIRQLLDAGGRVTLESSWAAPYHDLIGTGRLTVTSKYTSLRTQTKNASREYMLGRFGANLPMPGARTIQVSYAPQTVREAGGSVLRAMLRTCGLDEDRADFSLPVPDAWVRAATELVAGASRPIMLYRPLVERTEWGGCAARNPDHDAYAAIARHAARDRHVVSIADLVPGVEWEVGRPLAADQMFHKGELCFEQIAGLVKLASVCVTSPGFMAPLALAIGTPVAVVFGGYECGRSFSLHPPGSRYLPIDTVRPCMCFSHTHNCVKRINLADALPKLEDFLHADPVCVP